MATYCPMVITSAGQQALAEAQAGETLTFTRFQIGSGQLATTLTSALTQGSAYSSLSVAATSRAINSGDSITIGVGASAQTVTASATAAAGSTSISVTSFTAAASFVVGTIVTDITDAQNLTAIITPIDYFSVNTENVNGSTANVTGIYQNTNLTASTYTCEIGLYASTTTTGEVLYAYANAGTLGDTFPAYSSGPFSRQFQISTSVANVATVTANVPSTVYLTETEKGAAYGVASLDANKNVNEMKAIVADIFGSTSVVLSGGVATKDGTVANQLDVTAADVYFSTGEHISFSASAAGQFTTASASTTYYLDYNPDGTTSWGTVHSTQMGYVPICSVTTDTGGNISAVTDARPTTVELFHGATAVDGSKITGVPAANLTGGPIPTAVLPPASETELGAVETSVTPTGTPVAVITDDPKYENAAQVNQATTFQSVLKAENGAISFGDQSGTAAWIDSSGDASFVGVISGNGSGITNVNSSELGGQPPSYYATESSLQANSSASGTWTPASGTFNVASGTVMNVASVPSGAKMWMAIPTITNGNNDYAYGFTLAGSQTLWVFAGNAYSSGLSSTSVQGSSELLYFYDGSYAAGGYFQINAGYLQFVVVIAGTASTYTAQSIGWGVA